jgi:hypothetical protein
MMENIIKGLHLLKDVAKPDIDQMEGMAKMYWQEYAITFQIIKVTDSDITIRVTQGNTPDGKYHNAAALIGFTRLVFDIYFPSHKVLVHPAPHVMNPVDVVTAEWIRDKMLTTGTRLKDIVAETGLNKSYLSTLTNGADPLSDMAKAMFFYYFLSKEHAGIKVRKAEKKDEL